MSVFKLVIAVFFVLGIMFALRPKDETAGDGATNSGTAAKESFLPTTRFSAAADALNR